MSSINRSDLTRFAWLSILAALVTIGLKLGAFWLTNSVGLLSDAIESLVNLVTAIVALIALMIAARPANDEFSYGYSRVGIFLERLRRQHDPGRRQQHPVFSRMVCRIPGWKWDSSYEEFLDLAHTLRGGLQPR